VPHFNAATNRGDLIGPARLREAILLHCENALLQLVMAAGSPVGESLLGCNAYPIDLRRLIEASRKSAYVEWQACDIGNCLLCVAH